MGHCVFSISKCKKWPKTLTCHDAISSKFIRVWKPPSFSTMTCRLIGSGLYLMMIMDYHHKGWSYIKMNMVLQCLAVLQRSVFLQVQCLSWHKIDSTLAWMWIAVCCLLFERPGMMWEWHFPLRIWCCRVNAILDFGILCLCESNPTENVMKLQI